jgi:excisionase family DNA binding protein
MPKVLENTEQRSQTTLKAPSGRLRDGTVVRINKEGLMFIRDLHSPHTFVCTFDKISGYQGERSEELGLQEGSRVKFSTVGDEVNYLEVIKMPEDARMLTVPEVAEVLRVSPKLVYKLIRKGDLPHVRIGRLLRIRSENVSILARGEVK